MSDKPQDFRWQWQEAFASEHGPPDPSTRHVLHVIAMHLWKGDKKTYPGQERIAKFTGLSVRSVRSHLKIAERLGWLRIVPVVGVRDEYYPTIPAKLDNVQTVNPGNGCRGKTTRRTAATPAPRAGVGGLSTPANNVSDPGKSGHGPRQILPPTPATVAADASSYASSDSSFIQKDPPKPSQGRASVVNDDLNNGAGNGAGQEGGCVFEKVNGAKTETKPQPKEQAKMRQPLKPTPNPFNRERQYAKITGTARLDAARTLAAVAGISAATRQVQIDAGRSRRPSAVAH